MRGVGRHASPSNGKVGINGISYYANQWNVGRRSRRTSPRYASGKVRRRHHRELCRHGGILCDFLNNWHPRQVASVQHGVGTRGAKSVVTGEPVAGPETLTKEELAKNCADTPSEAKRRALRDDYYAARTAEFEQIEAPLRAVGRQLGRHGTAHTRQLRRLARRRFQAEMAGGARQHALHAFLQPLRRRLAEALLRPFPQRSGHRFGQAAAGVAQHPPSGPKSSCCAPRTNGRSSARNGPNIFCSRTAGLLPKACWRQR